MSVGLGMDIGVRNASARHKEVRGFRSVFLRHELAWDGARGFGSVLLRHCHDHDIPPQPSHTYSCLLTVQTPPKQSLTKPEPIPGLPNPSIAFLNPSATFLKGCCTDVCLVSIPEVVNIIPEHTWPFLTNPKHLKSHRPTPSLHAHLWTWRLSICDHDQVKPECLAIFPIESYFFLSYLFLSVPPYPCLVPSVTPFLCQPCIRLVLIVPSHTLTHPVITTCDYTQTIPSRSLSLVLPSISSLCILCIPQSEYHLWYSSLWSDPIIRGQTIYRECEYSSWVVRDWGTIYL